MTKSHRHQLVDPRQARRNAKIADILAEAWLLVERDGLAPISLRDLAGRVNLRQPSLSRVLRLQARPPRRDVRRRVRPARNVLGRSAAARRAASCGRAICGRAPAIRQRRTGCAPTALPARDPRFAPSTAFWEVALEFYGRARAVLADAGVEHQDDVDIFSALVAGLCDQQMANDPGGDWWVEHVPRVVAMFLAGAMPAT